MTHLNAFDLPSLTRFAVGFDRMFDELAENAHHMSKVNYPPYNIVQRGENEYAIEIAVAGFSEAEIEVEIHNGYLTVKGEKKNTASESSFLYRGISTRNFSRTVKLAEFIEVRGASIDNGMLMVYLERVIPESMKPRKIAISAGSYAPAIESKEPKLVSN